MCVFPFQLLPVALRTFPVNDKGLFGKWSKLCLKLINSSLGFRFAINCTEIDLAKIVPTEPFRALEIITLQLTRRFRVQLLFSR